MNKKLAIIGVDTSNYTTSIALVDLEGKVIANLKRLLPVKQGEVGLRQSDAVFSHVKNLPELMTQLQDYMKDYRLVSVGVSEKPRNVEGSYMPCFLSGVAVAQAISTTVSVPLYKFSHQCGHIMAALYSSGMKNLCLDRDFVAFHVSGGTTEMLKVRQCDNGFSIDQVGGTKDLNAGQVIDRVGVYLGLGFPAGKELEALALKYQGKIPKRKVIEQEGYINLSGLENIAKKLYDEEKDREKVAAFVLDYLARAIEAMSRSYINKYGDSPIVYAGGVMSNSLIKSYLEPRFDAHFAEPALSCDNAVGIAFLARDKYLKSQVI